MRRLNEIGLALGMLVIGLILPMVALAGQVKVDVCHTEGNGTYHHIEIAEPAYETHIAHDDAGVGEPVPGQPGFVFDAECNPVEACPCFTEADIQQGTIAECGENFPAFPDLAGVIYTDGRGACSGLIAQRLMF